MQCTVGSCYGNLSIYSNFACTNSIANPLYSTQDIFMILLLIKFVITRAYCTFGNISVVVMQNYGLWLAELWIDVFELNVKDGFELL